MAREVEVMSGLTPRAHNHIIEILDHGSLGEHTASYFIDMEYCDINLDEYIRGVRTSIRGLMDYAKAIEQEQQSFIVCSILQQLISGLVFLHNQGKVHRDLKP